MTDTTRAPITLEGLDLAALVASRVCHDVISPVGAIVNGLELLDDNADASTRDMALDLIRKSASQAAAKLKFCRLAFGAAGSAGAAIDTRDAQAVAVDFLTDDRTKVEWNIPPAYLPKNRVKLLLNLLLIAAAAVPRGGLIKIDPIGAGDETAFRILANGPNMRVPPHVDSLMAGIPTNDNNSIDGHSIQPFFTGLLARAASLSVSVAMTEQGVLVKAEPKEVASAAEG